MKPSQNNERKAAFFNALSHRRRQMLCEILVGQGDKGLRFGALQNKTGMSAATLHHHLRFMDQGGILQRRQKGRETWISLNTAYLCDSVIGFGKQVTQL